MRKPSRGEVILLNRGRGKATNRESGVEQMVGTFRSHSRTNYYFAFSVYEDSFAAFNRAKGTAVSLGFQYGWEPMAQNEQLKFVERGENTPPQN